MNTTRVLESSRGSIQCFTGVIRLNPNQLIGATNGVLFVGGTSIPITQPVVPGNRGLPLAQADGLTARVCGRFRFDVGQPVLVVSFVQPLLR